MPRPFKAYPKDPAIMAAATDPLVGMDTAEAYARYREKMLSSFQVRTLLTFSVLIVFLCIFFHFCTLCLFYI